MKPFNLEEAINGKAFYLENGYRGIIKYCVDDYITQFEQPPNYPYVGYVLDNKGFLFTAHTAWNDNGGSNEYPSFNATTMVENTAQTEEKPMKPLKPFNLEDALAGEPVVLRNGCKADILYVIPDTYKFPNGTTFNYPVRGITFNKDGTLDGAHRWNIDGTSYSRAETSPMDIIGMWEEPELTQEELFEKALKEKLPLRYKGLDKDYADVYIVAKSMSGSYILEWKDGTDTCVSILSNLPKFEWYLASEKPVKETGTIGLPKPFIPKQGEEYFSVSPHYDRPESFYANYLKHPSIKNGNCFKTEEDAQKWIDFMKSQIEE